MTPEEVIRHEIEQLEDMIDIQERLVMATGRRVTAEFDGLSSARAVATMLEGAAEEARARMAAADDLRSRREALLDLAAVLCSPTSAEPPEGWSR